MKYTCEQAIIRERQTLTPTVTALTLDAPAVAATAAPGQFVNILCDGFTLRRPISLAGIDRAAGTLRLVVEDRGKGTAWLCARAVGDTLDLLGPLGHGFPAVDAGCRLIAVGGGVGCPPLLGAAADAVARGAAVTAVCGFRNAAAVMLQDEFAALGVQTVLCTDDGSAGRHGLVTAALEDLLAQDAADTVIFTCGPRVMMRAVAGLAERYGVRCFVSMEERMACGVGACLGCVCRTHGADGDTHLNKVCECGPVFDAKEVAWE